MSHSAAVSPDACETHSQRDRIRSHMKMVIQQLEGILTELKDVAKELREVVGQIDKLTADFDFDQEPDDWTVATVSSTSSSERGLGDTFRLDLFNPDILSDCWDFSGFLEATSPGTSAGPKPPSPSSRPPEESETGAEPATVPATTPYSQMNGGLPIPNGPLVVTPDSSSEEATSSTYSHKTSRTSGTRERVRFSDKILYHALCCDDDDEDEGEEDLSRATPDSELSPPLTSPTPPENHALHNCLHSSVPRPPTVRPDRGPGTPAPPRKSLLNPGCQKKLLRNSSTQTVSDKSTQTVLPYVPAKHKTKDKR